MYQRKNAPGTQDVTALLDWLILELDAIQQSFSTHDFIRLKEWHSQPPKVFTGLVVLADGTDWEPVEGGGQGVYCYYNNTWNKLG